VNIFGAIPLNPVEGVEVVVADMVGGSRGSVLVSETEASRLATMESMEGVGSKVAGEFGSWMLW
jgi:hypothetical protein